MKKVLIDYGRLTVANLVERADAVVAGLTNNNSFPALPVALAAVTTKIADVQKAANNAKNRDRQELAILRQQKLELAGMLKTNAEYVNTTAAGDEAKLLSSGYTVSKTPEKHHLPGMVSKIDARFTNLPQTIELLWSRSKHASYYEVYISTNNGTSWTLYNTVIGRRLMIESLASGTRYQTKVVPVNKNGKGVASDVASQIAA